jgi:hypothetical protein
VCFQPVDSLLRVISKPYPFCNSGFDQPSKPVSLLLLYFLQGFVSPDIVPGTNAAVFAVYDEQQKLQYIGFSKELRGSLRTVLGRRPDKAFYFK